MADDTGSEPLPKFRHDFDPRHGDCVELEPGIARIVADNGSPFTFHGTNTYLLGTDTLAVIDPGPADDRHLQAILKAVGSRTVSHIIVTHTHADHSPLARPLAEATGALVVAPWAARGGSGTGTGRDQPARCGRRYRFRAGPKRPPRRYDRGKRLGVEGLGKRRVIR